MKSVDQLINGAQAVLFGDVGQVGITGGCGRTGMAEDMLYMEQTQTLFKQMGGKAVA
jgi:hypothetical protein